MSKYMDEALELIELVARNSHHHVAKSFGGRSAPAKGRMLDAKAAETGMLFNKIEKLTEAQNLIMDSLKLRPGSDGLVLVSHVHVSPCSHCSSFEHVELDCPVMAIQGPFSFRPNPTTYPGLSQAGRSNYPNQGYSSFHNPSYAQQRNTLDIISPMDPRRSIWETRGRHLSPPVFPEWLHRHRQSHLQHLQLIPS